MREQHPIDELFKEAFKHAKMAPPATAWSRIEAESSFGARTLRDLKRRWKYGLLALLLVSSAGAALLNFNPDDGPVSNSDRSAMVPATRAEGELVADVQQHVEQYQQAVEQVHRDNAKATVSNANNSSSLEKLDKKMVEKHEESVPTEETLATNDLAATHAESTTSSDTPSPQHERSNHATAATTEARTSTSNTLAVLRNTNVTEKGRDENDVANNDNTDGSLLASNDALAGPALGHLGPAGERQDGTAHWAQWNPTSMSPRISRVNRGLPGRRPNWIRHQPAPKALPPGEWWVGGELGYYGVNGSWTAIRAQARQLAKEATAAENWRSSLSVDFMGGRQWGNGLQFSIGVGLDNIRSEFHYTKVTTSEVTIGTTTQLVQFNTAHNAKNILSVLRVPVEGAWHKKWKRFMGGPRAGFINEFTMTRDGLTLISTGSDRSTDIVSSDVEVVKSHYPYRLSGTVGLDLGYMLTHTVYLWVTPTYTTDLLLRVGNGEMAPDLSRTGARVRLQFLLPDRY